MDKQITVTLEDEEVHVITHVLKTFIELCDDLKVGIGDTTREIISDTIRKIGGYNVH